MPRIATSLRCARRPYGWIALALLAAVLAGVAAPTGIAHAAARPRHAAARPRRAPADHASRSRRIRKGRKVRKGHSGRTFYVSNDGQDANPGTSPGRSWRTVSRVNDETLRPGDRVLFEGGEAFDDATLMPGQGFEDSGAPGRPIRFGSYGRGVATLTQGIWLGRGANHPHGPSYLAFSRLALGPVRGFQGVASHITIAHLRIADLLGPGARQETGVQSEGSHWTIADNLIERTGDSGMLLGASADTAGDPAGGRFYAVHGNTILDTGLDPRVSWPAHGIYLKVANAHVYDNHITDFRNDGISVRYRDAWIDANVIADGQIGIAWYQYDRTGGRSGFIDNRITDMSEAGIFVCGVAEDCIRPLESFDIARNAIRDIHGMAMNLQPTVGAYVLRPGLRG